MTNYIAKYSNIGGILYFIFIFIDVVDKFIRFILQGLNGTEESLVSSIRALIYFIKNFKSKIILIYFNFLR